MAVIFPSGGGDTKKARQEGYQEGYQAGGRESISKISGETLEFGYKDKINELKGKITLVMPISGRLSFVINARVSTTYDTDTGLVVYITLNDNEIGYFTKPENDDNLDVRFTMGSMPSLLYDYSGPYEQSISGIDVNEGDILNIYTASEISSGIDYALDKAKKGEVNNIFIKGNIRNRIKIK